MENVEGHGVQPTHNRRGCNQRQHLWLQIPRLRNKIAVHELQQLLIASIVVHKAKKLLQLLGVADAEQCL